MTTPHVYNRNRRSAPLRAIDIGPGTPWANPFVIRRDGSREEICEQFDLWVRRGPDMRARWIRDNIHLLVDQDLLCSCVPARCHGETLLRMAAEVEAKLKTRKPTGTRSQRDLAPQPQFAAAAGSKTAKPPRDVSDRVRRSRSPRKPVHPVQPVRTAADSTQTGTHPPGIVAVDIARITLGRSSFEIQVSSLDLDGRVVSAEDPTAAMFVGQTCAEVATWVSSLGGGFEAFRGGQRVSLDHLVQQESKAS